MAGRRVRGAGGPGWGRSALRTLVTACIGVAGGLLGVVSDLPAGALLGSMAFVGTYNIVSDGKAQLVPVVRDGARVLTGTTVGSMATAAMLATLGAYLPWILAATVLTIGVGLACGWLFARVSGIDRATAMLAYSPGGLPEMSALADEMGARTEIVVGVQVVRKLMALSGVITVIAVFGLA
jgi:uncharacterized protein